MSLYACRLNSHLEKINSMGPLAKKCFIYSWRSVNIFDVVRPCKVWNIYTTYAYTCKFVTKVTGESSSEYMHLLQQKIKLCMSA